MNLNLVRFLGYKDRLLVVPHAHFFSKNLSSQYLTKITLWTLLMFTTTSAITSCGWVTPEYWSDESIRPRTLSPNPVPSTSDSLSQSVGTGQTTGEELTSSRSHNQNSDQHQPARSSIMIFSSGDHGIRGPETSSTSSSSTSSVPPPPHSSLNNLSAAALAQNQAGSGIAAGNSSISASTSSSAEASSSPESPPRSPNGSLNGSFIASDGQLPGEMVPLLVNAETPQNLQCARIYPDMLEVGTPLLSTVMSLDPDSIRDEVARDTARGSQIMIKNMVSSSRPIHPIAFFSTIKHFESPNSLNRWGYWDFEFTSTLCVSWECSGYFQVDVRIEPDWSLDHVCGPDGMKILGKKGGPDFCAALFWWTQAANGSKCRHLQGQGNPCWDQNYDWKVSTFESAYKVYDQLNQWARYGIYDSWGRAYTGGMVNHEYFMGYENCAAQHYAHEPTPESSIKKAVAQFASDIGIY